MNTPKELSGFVRVILKEKGKYLVLAEKRGETLWNFPGGRCEQGESAEETAKREIFEETGVILRRLAVVLRNEFDIKGTRWNGTFFMALEAEGSPKALEGEKCIQMMFVTEEELMQLPGIRSVFQEILSIQEVKSLSSSFVHE